MSAKHYLKMSASDVVTSVYQVFAAPSTETSATDRRDAARGLLENAPALELVNHRMSNSTATDVDLISRVLTTRAWDIRDDYNRTPPKNFLLDLFLPASENNPEGRGLVSILDPGVQAIVRNITDYSPGEFRFIGDKTDDWPTEGDGARAPRIDGVKYVGKSVEYGILELWQAARDGRDIVGRRIRNAYTDYDRFLDRLIAVGAPLHGIFGFLGHPDIPTSTVVPSVVNGPATDWPNKTPGEVMFDLADMRDAGYSDLQYMDVPDMMLVSAKRHSFISSARVGVTQESILSRWIADQAALPNGGMRTVLPFQPYDTAGPGGTPIATVGSLTSENIEFPMLPLTQIPTEYHGAKWKIGFVGAASSVLIRDTTKFRTWRGI